MAINITSQMTPDKILEVAHNSTAVPASVSVFILYTLFFWVTAWLIIDWENTSFTKVFLLWFITFLLLGVATLIIALSPEMIQNIAEFAKKVFSM